MNPGATRQPAVRPSGAPAGGGASPQLALVLAAAAAAFARLRAGQSLDRALAAMPAAPPGVDPAAWSGAVRAVCAHAVRRCLLAEARVASLCRRPPDPAVAALLAVALAQLLAGSYAPHVLVDQAVRAARAQPELAGASGFVNAVLRAHLRENAAAGSKRSAVSEAHPVPGTDASAGGSVDTDTVALAHNLPAWWLARLRAHLGADLAAVLAAQAREPPQVLRVNRRRSSVAAVAAQLEAAGHAVRVLDERALEMVQPCPVERLPGFAEGAFSVQDTGAQRAAAWLDPRDGQRVLDACAAPGGKTAHLLEWSDCQVLAVERDAARAARIVPGLQRLGLADRASLCVADAARTADWWDGRQFDRILLDAPCTGSGVVRRHPDIPLLRRASDVANLATQQGRMMDALWPLLAPAGRLLYVVCSVFAEEGEDQVSAFLARTPDARFLPLPLPLPAGGTERPLPAGGLLLLPGGGAAGGSAGHDGFFYALLEKTAS